MDDIDRAQNEEMAIREAAIASHSSPKLDPGVEGECSWCGEWRGRLIGGACGFCRDEYKLP